MGTMGRWIMKARTLVWSEPLRPGIWRRKAGGLLFVTYLRTRGGKRVAATKTFLPATLSIGEAQRAYDAFRSERERATAGETLSAAMLFASYAGSLLAAKAAAGDIRSAKGLQKWKDILTHHLIPAFGSIPMHDLRPSDVAEWRRALAARVRARERVADATGAMRRNREHLSPRTVNTWFSVLRVITSRAVIELELERDPCVGLENLDASEHPTYTDEEPNALTSADAGRFLRAVRSLYPQHYAFVLLGLATGLRPSSLRPIRRSGPNRDLVIHEDGTGVLRVRRSHTVGDAVMGSTKTKRWQTVPLPAELVSVLREHCALVDAEAQRVDPRFDRDRGASSELLFPSRTGGFRSSTALDKVFRRVGREIGLAYRVTPRAMRRTFQDLARLAEVDAVVTRSISGHATESMQTHYSTAQRGEQMAGIAKVIRMFERRETG